MNLRRYPGLVARMMWTGALIVGARAAADRHLAGCGSCRQAVLQEQQIAQRISSRLRQDTKDLKLRPEIRNRILKAAVGRPAAPGVREIIAGWWHSYARLAAIPASAVLVAAFLLAGYFHFHDAGLYYGQRHRWHSRVRRARRWPSKFPIICPATPFTGKAIS